MSNQVLYRKYRPLNFEQVVSQEHIKSTLRNAVINDRVGHAYLFTGPRGVGKTTLARIYARAVNCPNVNNGEPCNNCDICREILNNTCLDVLEIDAASNTGVDNIRELIDHLQFSPTRAKYKVIIVDEVHMLSKGAFNALLKTLEEPPKHAIFILATTEIHKVPATIVSRTQRFDFKKVSIADLTKLLKYVAQDNKVEITDEALVSISIAADGSFRDGLSLLDQVINYAAGKVTEDLVEQVLGLTGLKTVSGFLDLLLNNDTQAAVNFISKLLYAGKDLQQFQKDFLEYLRKVLLVKTGAVQEFGFTEDMQKILNAQAQNITLEKLLATIDAFQKAGSEIKWASIQSLPLELAAVAVTSANTTGNPTEVEGSLKKEIPHEASVQNDENDNDALNKIISAWPQVLDKVKEYNHSLLPSLKIAQPVSVLGKELILTFPYKFHKDAVEQRKNRIVVDQVLEEITGMKLMVKPILSKDQPAPTEQTAAESVKKREPDGLISSALKIMGGEVDSSV